MRKHIDADKRTSRCRQKAAGKSVVHCASAAARLPLLLQVRPQALLPVPPLQSLKLPRLLLLTPQPSLQPQLSSQLQPRPLPPPLQSQPSRRRHSSSRCRRRQSRNRQRRSRRSYSHCGAPGCSRRHHRSTRRRSSICLARTMPRLPPLEPPRHCCTSTNCHPGWHHTVERCGQWQPCIAAQSVPLNTEI